MLQQVQPKSKPKAKTRKALKNTVSTFISKTFEILEDNQFPDIVDWNLDGTAIVIKNPLEFSQKVLNQYFKHRNLTSFVRQLNMYGFHKQRTLKIEHIYSHELFQRNKKHLLDQIKRKIHDQINIEPVDSIDEPESVDPNQDIGSLMQEKQVLKRYNIQASTKINNLEGKIKDLAIQNQILRDQISQQDERDRILISLMASILKKYGIPPTELSLILREGTRGTALQNSTEATMNAFPLLLPHQPLQNHSNASNNSNSEVSDVGDFLNLNRDGSSKMASTVLHNMTNFDDKNYNRDVSPRTNINNINDIHMNWEASVSRQKLANPFGMKNFQERRKDNMLQGGMLIKPQFMKEKEKSSTKRNSGSSRNRIAISNEGNLVKRRFEEEGATIEVITKKVELNPIIKRNSIKGPFEN